jgi:CDP-4-dehydro-6-deoxyglucose reductase
MSLRHAVLLRARDLTPEVRELTLLPDASLPHAPGQWVSLKIPRGDELLARSYSVASAARDDGAFELAVTRVEGGPGSTFLHAMMPGEGVQVGPPMGFFTLPEALDHPLLFVATGTGLAPLRAMLQHLARTGREVPVTLVLGVRTARDLLYDDELRALAASSAWFRYVPTLSRPDAGWTGHTGYVQDHLAALVPTLPGCHAYVCGLNAMLKDVRATLKGDLGFTRERIHTERYD